MLELLRAAHLVLLLICVDHAVAQDYTSYYKYLGGYPSSSECDWADDAQGIAHDDNNWFITQSHDIWKIPVEYDLRTVTNAPLDVLNPELSEYPELAGYNHLGDPVVYKCSGTDYLLLPLENENGLVQGAIAILRCTDLSYVAHFALPDPPLPLPPQANDAGWVAVRGSDGALFTSKQHVGPNVQAGHSGLRVYILDWALLHTSGVVDVFFQQEIPVFNEQGAPVEFKTMQGGEFAPGDKLLYLISGFLDDDDEEAASEGIHVLETTNYWRVQHSTNGFGHFNYYYNPGFGLPCCLNPSCCTANEPEGLTIWDLDDGRAPNILGQVHALMLDNDAPAVDQGDVYLFHYTNVIRVDPGQTCQPPACCIDPDPFQNCSIGSSPVPCGDELIGMPQCPLQSLGDAVNFAWPGSDIRMQAGTYAESVTISTRVRLSAMGGLVRIGG